MRKSTTWGPRRARQTANSRPRVLASKRVQGGYKVTARQVKEEDVASVAVLVAKSPRFYATLRKVIASARGYNQWPAIVLTKKVFIRGAPQRVVKLQGQD